jgi:hypothetical protein
MKNYNDTIRNRTRDFRFIVQCLNQLHLLCIPWKKCRTEAGMARSLRWLSNDLEHGRIMVRFQAGVNFLFSESSKCQSSGHWVASTLPSAEVKNVWTCNSSPSDTCIVWTETAVLSAYCRYKATTCCRPGRTRLLEKGHCWHWHGAMVIRPVTQALLTNQFVLCNSESRLL